jgi:hypothetical protein
MAHDFPFREFFGESNDFGSGGTLSAAERLA